MTDKAPPELVDTKLRIMYAAERLFAEKGFRRTSIRVIARMADVNQAAINYHFGSKDALVEKVIAHRLALINYMIMVNLQTVESTADRKGCPPETESVLWAVIEPPFKLAGVLTNVRYFLLIAGRALTEPHEAIRSLFINHSTSVLRLFFALIKKSLPRLSDDTLRWRLRFAIGALAHALYRNGSGKLSSGLSPSAEATDVVVSRLVGFISSGLKAPEHPDNRTFIGHMPHRQ